MDGVGVGETGVGREHMHVRSASSEPPRADSAAGMNHKPVENGDYKPVVVDSEAGSGGSCSPMDADDVDKDGADAGLSDVESDIDGGGGGVASESDDEVCGAGGVRAERLEQINSFLAQLSEQGAGTAGAIPDALVVEMMRECGAAHPDAQVVRLISLATHKYLLDIVNDTLQASKLKQVASLQKHRQAAAAAAGGAGGGDRRTLLTMDDLAPVLKEYGINVSHPPYYT